MEQEPGALYPHQDPAEKSRLTRFRHKAMKAQRGRGLPQSTSTEGRGRTHAQVWLTPQPTARRRGGGGWRQAGFHTVNYSVAKSAPRREAGERVSQSLPTAEKGTVLMEAAGRNRGPPRGKGPSGGQAVLREVWASLSTCPGIPAGGPMGRRPPQRAGERQPVQAWLAAWAGGSPRDSRNALCGSQTP